MEMLFGANDDNADNEARPDDAGVLSFHAGTEEALLLHVERTAQRGNPDDILKAIDTFCYSRHWMMHIGDKKLPYLQKGIDMALQFQRERSLLAVELGSYCGYSAISIAKKLREGDKLLSIEINPSCVAWSKRMVNYAGLDHIVTVLESTAEQCLEWNLKKNSISLLFIDHKKTEYLNSLISIEKNNLIKENCVVIADNVLFKQTLYDYLNYVRDENGTFKSSEIFECTVEYLLPSDIALNELDSNNNSSNYSNINGNNLKMQSLENAKDGIELSVHK
jgi:catechol O-methyltransferase